MGHDPRLPRMPEKPTLFDFFKYRFGPANHLLQSARLAQKNGVSEKIVLACLLHDIAITGFIRGDHGYWAAQLVEPYVDEEVSWAIRYHQVLRFYPDESVGYKYPELYIRSCSAPDYRPEPYIQRAYRIRARAQVVHDVRACITVNDLYAFDPNVQVELEEFTDVVGRHFKQPKEGLGFDASPSAHMWRTISGRRSTCRPERAAATELGGRSTISARRAGHQVPGPSFRSISTHVGSLKPSWLRNETSSKPQDLKNRRFSSSSSRTPSVIRESPRRRASRSASSTSILAMPCLRRSGWTESRPM